MSRVGKQPIEIPSGVTVSQSSGVVTVEGPRGKLDYRPGSGVSVASEEGKVTVSVLSEDKQARSNFGTTRAIINNMVVGVTKGWKRALELSGVGYTAELQGSELALSVGYSHEVKITIPEGVTCKASKTAIELEGNDKQLVGVTAAKIRWVRPPEPYLGKGILYAGEQIRRKAGKAGVT
jgi:large subunit ribosomal protein L6